MSSELSISSSASSSGASPNYNACLGDAQIPPDIVDAVVTDLIKRLAPVYLEMVSEAHKRLELEPDFNHNHSTILLPTLLNANGIRKAKSVGVFSIPCKFQDSQQCYLIDVAYEDITQIDKDSPLRVLVDNLRQRITKLGISLKEKVILVRFNKGFVDHRAAIWHRDSDDREIRTATVCYSNIANWTTRIVDPACNQKIPGGTTKPFSSEEMAAIEHVAQPSIRGVLYDGCIGIHRAPRLDDLEATKISCDDWRLFVGFA